MNKNSSKDIIHEIPILPDDFYENISKYAENLTYHIIFDSDYVSNINKDDLIEECKEICDNLSKEIKQLLVISIFLHEIDFDFDRAFEIEMNIRIRKEIEISNNKVMEKLFREENIIRREDNKDEMSIFITFRKKN